MVFIDRDIDRELSEGEVLLRQSSLPRGRWLWRGAGRRFLRFRADGSVMEMGTYTWCNEAGNDRHARQLTLNRLGRSYISRDKDGDGVHDANTSRKPISCPEFET